MNHDDTDVWAVLLDGLRGGVELERVLEPIEQGIRRNQARIAQVSVPEVAAVLDEDEHGIADGLLGAAFVVYQAEINRVVSWVYGLHRHAQRLHRAGDLSGLPGAQGKAALLDFGTARIGGTTFGQIEVLNALANYFKHRDEWG